MFYKICTNIINILKFLRKNSSEYIHRFMDWSFVFYIWSICKMKECKNLESWLGIEYRNVYDFDSSVLISKILSVPFSIYIYVFETVTKWMIWFVIVSVTEIRIEFVEIHHNLIHFFDLTNHWNILNANK